MKQKKMNIGTYFNNKTNFLYWLLSATILVVFISLGIWLHEKVIDSSYERQKLYQTALKTQDKDEFNYSVDSRQGNVLSYGTFTFIDFVKFPEMNKEFSKVTKTEERYTRHQHEECDTDEDGNDTNCRTVVDYSWDYNGRETIEGQKVKFFDREYNTSKFSFHSDRSVNASEIIPGANEYWYPEGYKGEGFLGFGGASEGDLRYEYDVRDNSTVGSIFINTYKGLNPAENNIIEVSDKTIKERFDSVIAEAQIAGIGFIVGWTLLTLCATGGSIYYWWVKVYDNY